MNLSLTITTLSDYAMDQIQPSKGVKSIKLKSSLGGNSSVILKKNFILLV